MMLSLLKKLSRKIKMSYLVNPITTATTATTTVTPYPALTGTGTVTTSVSPVLSHVTTNWWNMNTASSMPITINTTTCAALVVQSSTSDAVLTVHYDGRIEYTGKPSAASDAFIKSCCAHIDLKAAGKLALEKTYRRAVEHCLKHAKSMSYEDFIDMLENELSTRTSKAAWMRLSESDTEEK